MMVLYSGTTCPFSQRCRFVLFEKGMDFEIRDVDLYNKPEDISIMNPYGQVPVLVERDLILYESNIINEYIDERFPHPQLMPADPVMRARTRLFLFNFERELFVHVQTLERRDHDKGEHHDYAERRVVVHLPGDEAEYAAPDDAVHEGDGEFFQVEVADLCAAQGEVVHGAYDEGDGLVAGVAAEAGYDGHQGGQCHDFGDRVFKHADDARGEKCRAQVDDQPQPAGAEGLPGA